MPKNKNLEKQITEELLYWRNRLGFPDLQPKQTTLLPVTQKTPPRPEVDPLAAKEFKILVETVQSRVANVSHLGKLMSQLRSTCKACPTPPEIHAAADIVDRDAEGGAKLWDGKPVVCRFSACDGSGFVVDRTAGSPGSATFCKCHPGYVPPKGGSKHANATHSA